MAKVAEKEDPELTSSGGHTKIATISSATVYDNNLKTGRRNFPQLSIQRRTHNKMSRRDRDSVVKTHTPGRRPTNGKVITIAEVLPKEQRGLNPT